MKGREERDLKNKQWINDKMKTAPKPLKDFMQSFARKETTSQKAYYRYLMDFLKFIEKDCEINIEYYADYKKIKKMDIDAYMNYTEYSNTTGKKCGASIRNAKLIAVNAFFEFLVDNEIIDKNPCMRIDKIKETKEHEIIYLTKEEIECIGYRIMEGKFDTKSDEMWRYRDYAIFILGCTTGMRQSAIREINMEDINLENQEIIVTEKGNVTKTVYLSDKTVEALQNWIDKRKTLLGEKECDALFISNRRGRMSETALRAIMDRFSQYVGKHLTPHKMRSTCAMNLYSATNDIYLVAQQLGHKSIKNTQIYAKATKKQLKDTAKLMDKIYG